MNLPKHFPHKSSVIFTGFLVACMVILIVSAAPAFAQKDQEYQAGDIVDVTRFRKTFRGIVTNIDDGAGWPYVKYIGTDERSESEDKLELLDGGEFSPGAKVRFDRFGKPVEGFLLEARTRSKKFSTLWKIEVPKETEERFTGSRIRLVRRPSKQVDPYELRGWTDATGKFNVQAKFVARDGDTIELKRDNGKELKLPLKKLSRKDQKFLKTIASQIAENPSASVSSSSDPPTLEELFFELREIQNVPPKLALPELQKPEKVAWNVTPDPAEPAGPYTEMKLPSVIIGRKTEHNSFSEILASTPGGASAIGVVNELEKTSAAFTWKPGDAKATKFPIVKEESQLFAISPDGKIVVGKQGDSEAVLYFWDSHDGSAVDTWNLSVDAGGTELDPTYGRFIADKKLVTIGKHTICWDLEDPKSPKAIYAIKTPSVFWDPRFAFSANNKILAIENRDHEIYFIDPSNGKCHGILEAPFKSVFPKNISVSTSVRRRSFNGSISSNSRSRSVSYNRFSRTERRMGTFAFSPNGKLFAGITRNGEIFIWDLVANELAGNFFAATENPNRLNWADNDHLLVGNKLVNVHLGAAVWEIALDEGVTSIEQTPDGQVWGLSRYALTPLQLVPVSLPEKLEQLQLDKKDLLAISPDSEIAIKWSLPAFHRTDGVEPNQPATNPQKMLQTNITRNGQKINAGAEIVVTSSLDREKANKLELSDLFSSKVTGYVEEKRKEATVECKLGDELLWSKTRTFGLIWQTIGTEGNESYQQAVDRICTPTRSFYSEFYIPQYFYRLPGGKLLGKSKVTKAGVTPEN